MMVFVEVNLHQLPEQILKQFVVSISPDFQFFLDHLNNHLDLSSKICPKISNNMKFEISARSVPFNIRFLSDLYENGNEQKVTNNGFRLVYTMKSC